MLTIYCISVTLSVNFCRVAVRPTNTLWRLSPTELTTVVISVPYEGDPLLFHTLISSIIVIAGDNLRGRGGGLWDLKNQDPPSGRFITVFNFIGVRVKTSSIFPLTSPFETSLTTFI